MVGTHPIVLNYQELYGEPSNNPCGVNEEEKEDCRQVVYDMGRATTVPVKVDALLQHILADFSRPIGCIGLFMMDKDSPSG
jgi:hypothetical protein